MATKSKGKGKAAAKVPKLAGKYNLITCVIQAGYANKVAKAAMGAGAAGATIMPGRGMGMGQLLGALGHAIIPQKEVIMIVTAQKDTKRIFDAVSAAAELNRPGMGIAYVTTIGDVSGVAENTATKMVG